MTQKQPTSSTSSKTVSLAYIISGCLWLLFLGNLLLLLSFFTNQMEWYTGDWLRINGFTVTLWLTVTFFSAVIGSYALSYFKEESQKMKFMRLCLGFTLSVMLFAMAEHLLLLVLSWILMGFLMSKLIGLESQWGDAREAKRLTLRYFLIGSSFLSMGLALLAIFHGIETVSGLMASLADTPTYLLVLSALGIILAAMVQSAIFPFHNWLLSSMTAPTPASALMHAGFVNGSGIVLTLFAPLLVVSNTLELLFIIGGLTALLAQFTKLLQVNVKQRLACSTIAQMGFMIMQCGLGYFSAAITHLILHGFYKAYLFLSSGEEIERSIPVAPPIIRIKSVQAMVVMVFSLLGAYTFAKFTGKGMQWDSGIFLTLIASIAVGQVTYNIVKQQSLSRLQRALLPPVLFMLGIGVYALFYNGISLLLSDMPMVVSPTTLTPTQIVFGLIFLSGFFLMKLGIYRKIPWIYVKLLNLSQPKKQTLLMYKTKIQ